MQLFGDDWSHHTRVITYAHHLLGKNGKHDISIALCFLRLQEQPCSHGVVDRHVLLRLGSHELWQPRITLHIQIFFPPRKVVPVLLHKTRYTQQAFCCLDQIRAFDCSKVYAKIVRDVFATENYNHTWQLHPCASALGSTGKRSHCFVKLHNKEGTAFCLEGSRFFSHTQELAFKQLNFPV